MQSPWRASRPSPQSPCLLFFFTQGCAFTKTLGGKLTLRITDLRPLRSGQHTGRRAGVNRVDLHLRGNSMARAPNCQILQSIA
jgi:hypothetical protein